VLIFLKRANIIEGGVGKEDAFVFEGIISKGLA
jgi:hypothetical protein